MEQVKVMVVGAGGIGCELLKNLALMNVGFITIIDLDTIDVSNLNRQFLFRKEHVNRSKAEVAAEAARLINPNINVTWYQENIKSSRFSARFILEHNVVISALDNVQARKHLNRLCIACNVPLIEAGTAGFYGQCYVIRKGISECYECQPKSSTQKTFPVCTIRQTPSTPVHCVHWAKLLYDSLFGPDDVNNVMSDLKNSLSGSWCGLKCFSFLFSEEIEAQVCLMKSSSSSSSYPVPLKIENIDFEEEGERNFTNTKFQASWSLAGCAYAFISSVDKILKEKEFVGNLSYSKDSPLAVTFVASAANLRMLNFHIVSTLMSRWDLESIASAIVPAVATTNAIVAGLQCCNLAHLIEGRGSNDDKLRDVWVQYPGPSVGSCCGFILKPSRSARPNSSCFVCHSTAVFVRVSPSIFTEWSLKQFIHSVVISQLGIERPTVILKDESSGEEKIIYDWIMEEEDKEMFEESGVSLVLKEWSIDDGSVLSVDNGSGEFTSLYIEKREDDENQHRHSFSFERY